MMTPAGLICFFSKPGCVQEMGHCSLVLFLWDLGTVPTHLPLFPPTLLGISWLQCQGRNQGTLSDSAEVWLQSPGLEQLNAPGVTATSIMRYCAAGGDRKFASCHMAGKPCLGT